MKEIAKWIYRLTHRLFLLRRNVKLHNSVRFNRTTRFEGCNVVHKGTSVSGSSLGFATYIGVCCQLNDCIFGRYCSIADNVSVITATHPTSVFVSTHPLFYSPKKQCGYALVDEPLFEETLSIEGNSIIIGNDVWIGSNVKLVGGIRIGDGAIVAAGAYVTKDVPPYAIVGGVPAKIIRFRFSENERFCLMNAKWWNWSKEKIESNFLLFQNINQFIKHVNQNEYNDEKLS